MAIADAGLLIESGAMILVQRIETPRFAEEELAD